MLFPSLFGHAWTKEVALFLRRHRRTKDGKSHTYYALVESVRTDAGPRQRVVAHLGELNHDQERRWQRTVVFHNRQGAAEQLRLFSDDDHLPLPDDPDIVRIRLSTVGWTNPRRFGDIWLARWLWHFLDLERIVDRHVPQGKEDVRPADIVAIEVINRLCQPCSEFALAEHYDITSTYFEGLAEDNDLAKRGYSRDHRSDCKQVVIALIVTRDGFPLAHETFAGNTRDLKTVKHIVTTIEARFGKSQRVWVMVVTTSVEPRGAFTYVWNVAKFKAALAALGAILYAMLTSHPPFQGTTLVETLEHVQSLEPVPPRRLQVKVPRDLETICLKCLQKNPRQRYLNAETLADDLHRFLAAEPIEARPTPLWERGMKWARRRPALAALLHVSVAAVRTVLSVSLWFNALLQTSLTETRAQKARGDEEHIRADEEHTQVEEHRARLVQEEYGKRRHLQTLREAGQELLLAGQEAMGRLDWLDAKHHLGQAQAKLGSAPELADLRAHVDRRLTETERQLEEQAGQRAATDKYRQFVEFHDKALFQGTLFMGMDERFNLTEAVSFARKALGLFGLTESAPTVLKLPPRYLSAGEKDEITAGCYELFLLVGEAVAHPLPGQGPGEHRAHAREALGILDRARTLGPATHAYHLRRVKYLAVVGDKEGEETERRQAQAVPPTTASDFFLVGDQDYKAGNVAAALDHFQRALHLDPKHFWARYFEAVCLLEIGHHQEAIAYLTACASSRPAFPWIYVLRGHAYDQLLDFGTAAADFQKAVQLSPAKYAAEHGIYVNRGAMRIHQRKFDEAVADLHLAIKLKPELRQAYINLAEIDRQRKQYDQALRHLNEALRLEPKLARVYWLRARVYREQQALPAALADLDDAVRFEAPGSRRLAVYHF